ncbi:MAG TPA: TlpA disulfide reductase family protein [Longimicrobiaceae bacterium]|nr:TlpA disulfide reductase family protein [Longimicrobiaceae bacterium]
MKISNNIPGVTLGGIGWIILLGFLAYLMSPQVGAAFGIGAGGAVAPALAVETIDGGTASLEGYRGQVVLVNFWATWCPPCRIEMPGFQRVYEDKRDEGFVVLALSTESAGSGAVREFLDEHDITFPVAMASAQMIKDFGGVRALPTSFLIDRNGLVRQEIAGYFAAPALRMAVDKLLEEPATARDTMEVTDG